MSNAGFVYLFSESSESRENSEPGEIFAPNSVTRRSISQSTETDERQKEREHRVVQRGNISPRFLRALYQENIADNLDVNAYCSAFD